MSQILKDVQVPLVAGMENEDKGTWTSRLVTPVNYYAVKGPEGQAQPAFFRTPGFRGDPAPEVIDFAGYSHIYAYYRPGQIAVVDTDVLIAGTKVVGAVATGGVHKVLYNGTQYAIVCPYSVIVVAPPAALVAVHDAVLSNNCVGGVYQDGYGIFAQGASEKFWITGLDDFSTIGALDFSTADVFADLLVGIESDHRELYLFGKESIEIWQNTGAAGFPFQRSQGGVIEKGCVGGIAKADHKLFFVGNDRAVWMLQGYQPTRISNEAIEAALQEYGLATYGAFAYSSYGRTFYAVTVGASWGVGDGKTYVYDVGSGLWHRRLSYFGAVAGSANNSWEIGAMAQMDDLQGNWGLRRGAAQVVQLAEDYNREQNFGGTVTEDPGATVVSQKLAYGGRRFIVHRVRLLADSTTVPTTIKLTIDGVSRTLTAPTAPYQWNRLGVHREARLEFEVKSTAGMTIRGVQADIEVLDS